MLACTAQLPQIKTTFPALTPSPQLSRQLLEGGPGTHRDVPGTESPAGPLLLAREWLIHGLAPGGQPGVASGNASSPEPTRPTGHQARCGALSLVLEPGEETMTPRGQAVRGGQRPRRGPPEAHLTRPLRRERDVSSGKEQAAFWRPFPGTEFMPMNPPATGPLVGPCGAALVRGQRAAQRRVKDKSGSPRHSPAVTDTPQSLRVLP